MQEIFTRREELELHEHELQADIERAYEAVKKNFEKEGKLDPIELQKVNQCLAIVGKEPLSLFIEPKTPRAGSIASATVSAVAVASTTITSEPAVASRGGILNLVPTIFGGRGGSTLNRQRAATASSSAPVAQAATSTSSLTLVENTTTPAKLTPPVPPPRNRPIPPAPGTSAFNTAKPVGALSGVAMPSPRSPRDEVADQATDTTQKPASLTPDQ